MKTLNQNTLPHNEDVDLFPDGQIVNEEIGIIGTPVVKEVYGDILANIYAIIRKSGIVFNDEYDNEVNGYQLLDALKIFHNEINDLRQIITVPGFISPTANISTTMKLQNLPANYVFIAQITENLYGSVDYTLVSSVVGDNTTISIDSVGDIEASSYVLIVLEDSGAKIINLSSIGSSRADSSISTAFGNPIAYNDSETMLYFTQNGFMLTDYPKSYYLENIIQVSESNANLKIVDVVCLKGKVVCMTLDTSALKYQLFSFALSNLSVLEGEITIVDTSGVDNQTHLFTDGTDLFFSNSGTNINDNVNDHNFIRFSYDEDARTTALVSSFVLDSSFEKTTNTFITGSEVFTFIKGEFYSQNIDGTPRSLIGNFNALNGNVFKFNGSTYYSSGDTAVKWSY